MNACSASGFWSLMMKRSVRGRRRVDRLLPKLKPPPEASSPALFLEDEEVFALVRLTGVSVPARLTINASLRRLPDKRVGAGRIGFQHVTPASTIELGIAGPAKDQVVAQAAVNRHVAGACEDNVVARAAIDRVVAVSARDLVGSIGARK